MVYGGGAAAAAAHAAMVQAVKASGVLVRVEPEAFLKILKTSQEPMVVTAQGSFWDRGFKYLTSYKGIAFFTKSPTELKLPIDVEIVAAGQIWMPN